MRIDRDRDASSTHAMKDAERGVSFLSRWIRWITAIVDDVCDVDACESVDARDVEISMGERDVRDAR